MLSPDSGDHLPTVVLCDDHNIVRHAIRMLLESTGSYRVVGEADSVEQIIELTRESKPDLVLLDVGLKGKNGIEAIPELKKSNFDTKVAVFTMYDDPVKARQAVNAGASAYILKTCSINEMTAALSKALQGEVCLPNHLQAVLHGGDSKKDETHPLSKLSKREQEIFYFLAEGLPNRVIAKKLYISPRTVETHRARVLKKLGFKSGADLVRFAIKHELIMA